MGRTRIGDMGLPEVSDNSMSLTYKIIRPKEQVETVSLIGRIADGTILLPDHKQDALAMAGIVDAIQLIIGQSIRDDMKDYRVLLSDHNKAVKAATDKGEAKVVIGLLKDRPEKPELSDHTAEFIGPWTDWMDALSDAWKAAKKHTLSVYGTGSDKGNVVWTGTLSRLIGRKPAKGAIALGRRIR